MPFPMPGQRKRDEVKNTIGDITRKIGSAGYAVAAMIILSVVAVILSVIALVTAGKVRTA